MPKTGVLLPAPQSRFPLIRLAPKYDSSAAIPFRRISKYRLTVLRFKFVKIAIFFSDKSREK